MGKASLIQASKKEIISCCLKNGAIVAVPKSSKEVKDYFFVWPRDASYACLALDCMGIKGPQDAFFRWCLKAERFKELGIFLEKYKVNGRLETQNFRPERTTNWGSNFQPDQTGTVLFAVWNHYKDDLKGARKHSELIKRAANGLCRYWDKTNFKIVTQDVWERKFAFPDMEDNFTYSLAACARGLECAYEILKNKRWLEVSRQMKKRLDKHYKEYFYRSFGKVPDKDIDTSVLGLACPFQIYPAGDKRIDDTVKEIESRLVKDSGVYRFENDDYDGWMYNGIHRDKGSGFWPLLNLWLSIVVNRIGKRQKALKYYNKVVDSVDKAIPEQVFDNKIQQSPSPLCWAHAIFILASDELGFL